MITQLFQFLVSEYNFVYRQQEFKNAFHTHGSVYTHSYENKFGCFTIMSFPAKGELEFFVSKHFSTDLSALCASPVSIASIEKDIWEKHSRIGFIKNPFFWWSSKSVLRVSAEAIQTHIKKHGEFFGIKTAV